MKTLTFIVITLLAGAISGSILSVLNQIIVEPIIEKAIGLENQKAMAMGEIMNPTEFDSYRLWQKGGEIAAGTMLGTSYGALFGIVFAYSRRSIHVSSERKKALILSGVMLLVLYIVPGLKYPANPPGVGDPETLFVRQSLYIAYLAISGLSALGLALAYRKMGDGNSKKIIVPTMYAAIMLAAYFAMPPNPDEITAPMDFVISFRVASASTIAIFWGVLGIILGTLWNRTKPHEAAKISL